jgi:hypothetical protein
MTGRVLVVMVLVACDAGAKPEVTDPWAGSAPAPVDDRDALPIGAMIATNLAYSEARPFFDREYIYARFDDGTTAGLGRVRRAGGPVERVAGEFVHHGVVYRTDWRAHERAEVTLSRIVDGKSRVIARVPGAVAGKDFTVVAEHMYWTATMPVGVGQVVATDVRTGATTTALDCSAPEVCPRIVPGTPALAYIENDVYRLERGHAVPIQARCPLDPQTKLRQEPVRALGGFMLCEMRAIGAYDLDPLLAFPPPVLVSLEDGSRYAPRGLGTDATFVRGHWYHIVPGGIVRRSAIEGSDELVMRIDSGFDTMVVDEETLVWTNGSAMWSAQLE